MRELVWTELGSTCGCPHECEALLVLVTTHFEKRRLGGLRLEPLFVP